MLPLLLAWGNRMGLRFEDLDDQTRRFMVEEIEMDAKADRLYLSPWLSQTGQGDWSEILVEAARSGNDDTLASSIRLRGRLNRTAQRKAPKGFGTVTYRIPDTAPTTMAEGEFNRFYVRALCRRAIAEGIPRLEVYRAKAVADPRPDSQYKIGLLMDPEVVLTDARVSIGVETALGMPAGPNSGLTLRIPKDRR